MNRSLVRTRKFLAIAAVVSLATAVLAAGCGGGTSSADKTATAAAKAPATATKPPAAATATKPPTTATVAPRDSTSARGDRHGKRHRDHRQDRSGDVARQRPHRSQRQDALHVQGRRPEQRPELRPVNHRRQLAAASGDGHVVAPSGLSGQLGSFSRPDGSTQVMYKGMPLYTFVGDTAAGQANGQGLLNLWFAATP